MLSTLRRTRGETIVEVLVAFLIIVVGVMAALSTLDYFIVRRQVAKELVVATNLAREGIEAVRTIRDTNWLRYAGERRKCWNNEDPSDSDCSDPIEDGGHYIVDLDLSSYKFTLTPVTNALDLQTNATNASDYQLKKDDTTGVYTHTIPSGHTSVDTPYYREIKTGYVDDDGNGATSTGTNANVLRVTSKVEWSDRGTVYDVVLTTLLTDYLGRKDHN